jgi:hypothetical protein
VGARLDEQPELLFQVRAVDQRELITNVDSGLLLSKTGPDAAKVLVDDDISVLFGLDMADDTPSPGMPAKPDLVRSKAAKSERAKSSARAVAPEHIMPGGAAPRTPKTRGITTASAPVPLRTPGERRSAAAQAVPATNPGKAAAPRQANAAERITRPPANTLANAASGAKTGRTTAPSRSRRS